MKQKSIWIQDKNNNFESLQKNIETDILIIGGGMTGITIAFCLKDKNIKVTLIEQDQIGLGVTSKTTGKITYLQECIYQKLEHIYNKEKAIEYLKSQKEAIDFIKNNIEIYQIDCAFDQSPSYVFTQNEKEIKKIQEEANFLRENQIEVEEIKSLPNNYPVKYGIKVEDTYVFHPLEYIQGLVKQLKNVQIYEQTKVTDIKQENEMYLVCANNQVIKTKKIVLACHYPFFIYPYFFPMKTKLERSYVISGPSKNFHFSAITSNSPTHSIRYHQNQVIYLSNSHTIGKKIDENEQFKNLEKSFESIFHTKANYKWLNEDLITLDSLPLIGYLEKNNSNLLIGTGYNTWGMTNGTIAGIVLSNLILEGKSKYETLFDPTRKYNLEKIKNSIIYNGINAKNFIKSKIIKNQTFYKENVKIVSEKGTIYGIYTDSNNIEHKVYNTCPHMKCSLIFNQTEKTWDCPCHASRFDIDGNCIKGPSKYDIKVGSNKKEEKLDNKNR